MYESQKIDFYTFSSSAFIIDLWGNKIIYCLQIFNNEFGFSKIENTDDFNSISDKAIIISRRLDFTFKMN